MPKASWIAFVTVADPDTYAGFQQHAPAAFEKYGAEFLARGGKAETLEGKEWHRHVVIAFDSKRHALACYNSLEYQAAREHRAGACRTNILAVDGLLQT